MHFSELNSKGHRGRVGKGMTEKEDGDVGTVFLVETWPKAEHHPDWGENVRWRNQRKCQN